MRDDAVLRRALPLGRGLGPSIYITIYSPYTLSLLLLLSQAQTSFGTCVFEVAALP